MKKLLIASLALLSVNAYATDSGFYLGAQGGYANIGSFSQDNFASPTNMMDAINNELVTDNNYYNAVDIWSSTLAPTSSSFNSSSTGGFGARLFAGYQFNPYIALETGFLYLSQDVTITETTTGSGTVMQPGFFALSPTVSPVTASMTVRNKITENAVDLVGKFSYPLQDTGLSPYVKVGAAYVMPDLDTSIQSLSVNIQGVNMADVNLNQTNIKSNLDSSSLSSKLCPEGAVGVNYDINKNFSVDASWTFIKGQGGISNINFASLGLIAHFA